MMVVVCPANSELCLWQWMAKSNLIVSSCGARCCGAVGTSTCGGRKCQVTAQGTSSRDLPTVSADDDRRCALSQTPGERCSQDP